MKKVVALLSVLFTLAQLVILSVVQAAEIPTGSKNFAPVGINTATRTWNDGIPLQGSYLTVDSDGIIKGFAKDQNGVPWDGQKFKNTTDNILAYCLNFNQATPNGSAIPADDLTQEQKVLLSNLLKLGYVEQGQNVYKGPGVRTLSNIDAYTTTQWMVHEIVPTWDMSQFTITNPQLAAGVANLREWIHQDLSIKLEKIGEVVSNESTYRQSYRLTAPFNLQGSAMITLSKNIADAQIITKSGTKAVGMTTGVEIAVGEEFVISVPDATPTDEIQVVANGGTTSFTFMKYDRPAGTNQQQSLVIGDQYIAKDEQTEASMNWITETPNEQPKKVTVRTTATNKTDGTKVVEPEKIATIRDEIHYENLIPNREYTISGRLMDKVTGEALLVNDLPITAEKTFIPTESNGFETLDFTFDASLLAGKTIVVFEKLFLENREIASHEDINDVDQTVTIKETEKPKIPNTPNNPREEIKIQTTATDKESGLKVLEPLAKVIIEDKINYEGLKVNQKYTIVGQLMDKATGQPLEVDGKAVTAETTFTPTQSKGTTTVEFTVKASELTGKKVVVFEYLYEGESPNPIAEHADLDDEKQTVLFTTPTIATTATNKENGQKDLVPSKQVTIVDNVSYKNLIKGNEYIIQGTLMNKETGQPLLVDGKAVTATQVFVAKSQEGVVQLEFTFDGTSLEGKEVVVFERLMRQGTAIALHEDINDKNQTVYFRTPAKEVNDTKVTHNKNPQKQSPLKTDLRKKVLPKTGENQKMSLLLVVIGILMISLVFFYISKKKKV
ncbi:VaFE repeat-containing surface-anchored protein [Enterococcus faecalis]|uniref:VaFE repeat-containing surface-anchored protein n=1 Tax=Enterococcus faecalis TaxID=1351 RepID=UPI001143487D|nr:VaFE repeat-containing surface-anchored protein [Enterococcus faecalis]MBP4091611.1 VaFE repeat-containing surface-anchored protein [Enterococcus faecalis]MBP4103157.1 VaFE repeat-containing surface-anchored protein [Enterococcus faecalis]NSV85351.1 VaFE repeat-containing surface-anchored protein [Enterococcus faecalis]TQA92747.1 LPXTG cell wall anchor domain-containing protein [Enterococcus faecalis]